MITIYIRQALGKKHSAIWIKSPPSSGKTTLAASYVDKKKLPPLGIRWMSGTAI